jgi:hypothetical protein
MKRLCGVVFQLLLTSVTVVGIGCAASSLTPSAPSDNQVAKPQLGTTITERLYIADPYDGTISAFALPISRVSAPVAVVTLPAPSGLSFDSGGRLFVATLGIAVFDQPIRTGSSPAFTLTNDGFFGINGVAVDPSGNLFVIGENLRCGPSAACETQQSLTVYNGPINSLSTPSFTISDWRTPVGIAFDTNGHVWMLTLGELDEYSLPFTKRSTPIVRVSASSWEGDIALDASGRLYLGGNSGGINVYSVTSCSLVPDFTIPIFTPAALAFDGRGNLYELNFGPHGSPPDVLHVFSPPLDKSSTPRVSLSGKNWTSIAIGP